MSEILLDRIRLSADGALHLVVRVRTDGVAPPSAATVRFLARNGGGEVAVPAALVDEGEGEWSATCVVPHDALDALPADAVFVDCAVDVTIDGDVVSHRVAWGGGDPRWLPYPTAGRMLSLTRVTS